MFELEYLDELISPRFEFGEISISPEIVMFHEFLSTGGELPNLSDIESMVDDHNYSVLKKVAQNQCIENGLDGDDEEEVISLADLWYEDYYDIYFLGLTLYIKDVLEKLHLATIEFGRDGTGIIGDAQAVLIHGLIPQKYKNSFLLR